MKDNESGDSPSERSRFLDQIQIVLAGLPREQRAEAWLEFIGAALRVMNRSQILQLRSALLEQPESPVHQETLEVLEVLEGHLALRDFSDDLNDI